MARPMLAVDAAAERFAGAGAGVANALLTREYRAAFVLLEAGADR